MSDMEIKEASDLALRVERHGEFFFAFETKRGIVAGDKSLPSSLRKMATMIERYDEFSARHTAPVKVASDAD